MKNCFKNWSQSKADPTFQENERETLVFVIESTQGRRGQAMSTNREVAESKLLFALFRDVLSTMCTNTRRIFRKWFNSRMTDDFTQFRLKLKSVVKNIEGVSRVYTRDGSIHCDKGGSHHVISSPADLFNSGLYAVNHELLGSTSLA